MKEVALELMAEYLSFMRGVNFAHGCSEDATDQIYDREEHWREAIKEAERAAANGD